MSEYITEFGSLNDYRKGGVDVIDDDPRNYVFSNVFEVAARSSPFERVAVAKNFEFVIEAMRAEGQSSWYGAPHDEFALCMDGSVEIELVKLADPDSIDPGGEGAVQLSEDPRGPRMGRLVLGRGHQGLLPRGAAYRFAAEKPAVVLLQTLQGKLTVEKWSDICQTSRS